MRNLVVASAIALLSVTLFAETPDYLKPRPASEPIVTERDSYRVESSERDADDNRFRVGLGGSARFGQELSYGGGSESFELYSIGLDLQYNLLPQEDFNLWVGLSYNWTPEQEAIDYTESYAGEESGYAWTENYIGSIDIKGHDFRLMLIPEWQLTETFAVGLRLGVGIGFYDYELSETYSYTDEYDTISDSYKANGDDTIVSALVGVQATWMFTENVGLQAYCDGQLSTDMDVTVDGAKIGELDMSGISAGIALLGQF